MNQNRIRPLAVAACMLFLGGGYAQVTTLGNVPSAPTDFVGWDNTVLNDPLMIRHDANQPIEWYTNAIQRMYLTPTVTGFSFNGYTNLDVSGNLGIGDAFSATAPPLTRLHITENTTSLTNGYRDWMRFGLLATLGRNGAYFGLKDVGIDTDHPSVLNWSENSLGSEPLLFIFTCDPSGAGTAASNDGLELVRIQPDGSGDEGYFGIGDFNTAGVNPNERLDLLDRTIRLRDFSPVANNTYLNQAPNIDRVLVADENDGRVYWRPMSDFTGGAADCDWDKFSAGNHLRTAWNGAASGCPDEDSRVGIGVGTVPGAKLHVYRDFVSGGGGTENIAGLFDMEGTANSKLGLRSFARGTGTTHIGIQGRGLNASSINTGVSGIARVEEGSSTTNNRGVHGIGEVVDASSDFNHGVHAYANISNGVVGNNYGLRAQALAGDANSVVTNNYGVHANAGGNATNGYGIYAQALNASNIWAGYFNGKVYSPYGSWVPSDAGLKSSIEEFVPEDGTADVLMELRVRRYEYDQVGHPSMVLPEGQRVGLIAQELEEILPQLVTEAVHPAQYGPEGEELSSAVAFKAVNYTGLIPYLIHSMQQQQQRLDQLEQALASCCTHSMNEGGAMGDPVDEKGLNDAETDRLLSIAPNPFTDRTTINFTLERGGRTMLLVNSSDGKQLQVLHEEVKQAGEYQQVWQTSHLAPGIYYVTLLLDGEPLVKRAVKVQ